MSAALIAALLMQAAGPASRPPASTEDMPGWSKTPSSAEMAAAYPAEAKAANFASSAVIECTVTNEGGLTDCVTVTEGAPGFGAAALAVASGFRMPTKSPSGASTAGRTVRFPIQWLNPAKGRTQTIVVYDDTGRSGSVGYNCRVRDDRLLDNCVVVDVRPRGASLFDPAGEAVQRARAPAQAKPGSRHLIVVEVKPH